jgi:apolipoprotein D and lipocalin family protein
LPALKANEGRYNLKIGFLILITLLSLNTGCASMKHTYTVDNVDISKFMGKWYVIAGRFTFLENGAHNAVEEYSWNKKKNRIDVNFFFNQDKFDGKKRSYPQKAWIKNKNTNAHWKVQPIWPLKFDYHVIALDEDYAWTAIGVPSGKYLWIMSREWKMKEAELSLVLDKLQKINYPTDNLEYIPQKW